MRRPSDTKKGVSKKRIIISVVGVVVVLTAIILAVALAGSGGSGGGTNNTGDNANANAGDASCRLQAWTTGANAGDYTEFTYGSPDAACCAQLKCQYASVMPMACTNGQAMYEISCCDSQPGDFGTTCTGAVYSAATLSAATADCTPTGVESIMTCAPAPTNGKELAVTKQSPPQPPETNPPTEPPATDAPTAEPTEPETVAPTAPPTVEETAAPTKPAGNPDETCTQVDAPPGVKPGSCMQIMCMPDGIEIGEPFHVTVRWCLSRPRAFHGAFDMIDMVKKVPYGGTGYTPGKVAQCGEHTYKYTLNAKPQATGKYDIMFKWFIQPLWGPLAGNGYDPFPNMIAETGLATQPTYAGLVNDCAPVPDRLWTLKPTGKQDGIDFPVIPGCFTPGEPWTVQINTHLESLKLGADLHVNLQGGTGGDTYLGAKDIFIAESNVYGLKPNARATNWAAPLPGNYWTPNQITFTAAQTKLVTPDDNVYVAAFLVPAGQAYNAVKGWTFVEREFYLRMKFCP